MKKHSFFQLSRSDIRSLLVLAILLLCLLGYMLSIRLTAAANQDPHHSVSTLSTDSVSQKVKDSLEKQPLRSHLLDHVGSGARSSKSRQGQSQDTLQIETTNRYPGPPKQKHKTFLSSKLAKGETIELNRADTTQLKKVPGIGSSFAKRIVKFRELLGGYYYCIEQLQEVYGMDRERYSQIRSYMRLKEVPEAVPLSAISAASFPRHPYISYRQADKLKAYLRKGLLPEWKDLYASGLFSREDSLRISPYIEINH